MLRHVGLQLPLLIPSTLLRFKIDQRIYQLQLWLLILLYPLELRFDVINLRVDVFHLLFNVELHIMFMFSCLPLR
jgi:hypothetical protein